MFMRLGMVQYFNLVQGAILFEQILQELFVYVVIEVRNRHLNRRRVSDIVFVDLKKRI